MRKLMIGILAASSVLLAATPAVATQAPTHAKKPATAHAKFAKHDGVRGVVSARQNPDKTWTVTATLSGVPNNQYPIYITAGKHRPEVWNELACVINVTNADAAASCSATIDFEWNIPGARPLGVVVAYDAKDGTFPTLIQRHMARG